MNLKHIASCSGGKDSVASLILAKQYGEPLDEVVYCEVMFDKETSGEVPEHRDFIYTRLKPFVENHLNVPFTILKSNKTYIDIFTHIVTRGQNMGLHSGFPIPGMCVVNRDLKIPPIKNYWKQQSDEVVQYVGIASDEEKRLVRLQGTNKTSLLQKYKIPKCQTGKICAKHNLLSPIYEFTNRNGCWFCMNCKDAEWSHLIYNHSHLFDKLVELEQKFPDRSRRCLTHNETPIQIKNRIMQYGIQTTLFN